MSNLKICLNLRLFLNDLKKFTGLNAILGQLGINLKEFTNQYEQDFKKLPNWLGNFKLYVYTDKKFKIMLLNISFDYIVKQFFLLKYDNKLSFDSKNRILFTLEDIFILYKIYNSINEKLYMNKFHKNFNIVNIKTFLSVLKSMNIVSI